MVNCLNDLMKSHIDNKFQVLANSIWKRLLTECNRLSAANQNQSLHYTLRKLRQNKNIRICQHDKGNGVALDSEDRYSKLDHIIDDPTQFMKVNTNGKVNPIIAKEN